MADAGNGPKVVDEHFVAVYDPTDGRVVHLHTVRVFEGGTPVSQAEAEEGALAAAAKHGHATDELETLHTKEQPDHGRHRVDIDAQRLVTLEAPALRGGRAG